MLHCKIKIFPARQWLWFYLNFSSNYIDIFHLFKIKFHWIVNLSRIFALQLKLHISTVLIEIDSINLCILYVNTLKSKPYYNAVQTFSTNMLKRCTYFKLRIRYLKNEYHRWLIQRQFFIQSVIQCETKPPMYKHY
jgi:hypothetical protein